MCLKTKHGSRKNGKPDAIKLVLSHNRKGRNGCETSCHLASITFGWLTVVLGGGLRRAVR